MESFNWANRSDFYVHFQDSMIINPQSGINGYICFTIEELMRLRKAINKTLKAYRKLGWTDKEVNERNRYFVDSYWEEARRKSREEKAEPKAKKVSQDYLYLIHDTVQNTLKIGISANPKNRFRNIQLATSNKLVMLYALKGKAHLEKELHKEFAEIRLASEWFKYDERIINRYKDLQYGT